MFGVVPRTLWSRQHPPDEDNRIDMALRCLLVEADGKCILIDTGFGADRSARFRDMYAFDGSDDYLDRALGGAGLSRRDITDVVLTHLHFDHCGGTTCDKAGDPKLSFPNARHHYQKKQLDHARSRFERDKASYFPEDFELPITLGLAEIHDGNWELLPGFDCVVKEGHTPSMQLPCIKDGEKTILYGADLIPLSSHFPLPWIMAYDLYPVQTLAEKKKMLPVAAAERWLVVFEHDAKFAAGYVIQTEKGFALADPIPC